MSNTIYIITNTVNDKIYIGQSVQFDKRKADHLSNYKRIDYHIYRAMRKYGIDKFSIEPICSVLKYEDLSDLETQFIIEYDSFKNGYNMTMGGEGCVGRKSDQSHIDKISGKGNPSWKGQWHTPFGVFDILKDAKPYFKYVCRNAMESWCRNPNKLINKRSVWQSKYLTEDMVGKSFREIGFYTSRSQ